MKNTITLGLLFFLFNFSYGNSNHKRGCLGKENLAIKRDNIILNKVDERHTDLRKNGLSGIITVGGSNPNYATLIALANALNSVGVSGPVTVNVAPNSGPYDGSVIFNSIPGISSVNHVVINGNGNIITSNVSPIVKFFGTKYVTLDNFKILGKENFLGFGVQIGEQSQFITVKNSTIFTDTTSIRRRNAGISITSSDTIAGAYGNNGRNFTIENNTIIGGYFGIAVSGLDGVDIKIINNIITEFYSTGILLTTADTCFILNNKITRVNRVGFMNFTGIDIQSYSKNIKVINNSIHSEIAGYYTFFGINVWNMHNIENARTEFINNLIFNNNSTGNFVGLNFTNPSKVINIYHNTIYHNVKNSVGYVRCISFTDAPDKVNVLNNILYINGSGSGNKTNIYSAATSVTFVSNHNVLVNEAVGGNNFTANWNSNLPFSTWQLYGFDTNSVNKNPNFSNPEMHKFIPLEPSVNNLGANLGISYDIFSNNRNVAMPDPGAVENSALACTGKPFAGQAYADVNYTCSSIPFTLNLFNDTLRQNLSYQWLKSPSGLPGSYTISLNDTSRKVIKTQSSTHFYRCIVKCNSFSDTSQSVLVQTPSLPFNGNYTIDNSLPATVTNYTDINSLFKDMSCVGVSGPVTITLAYKSTPYFTNINIGEIPGASNINSVHINGNGNTIKAAGDFIVNLHHSNYLTFENFKIEGIDQSFEGSGIVLSGHTKYITIKNCIIKVSTISSKINHAGIAINNFNTNTNSAHHISLLNNQIIGGYYGVSAFGNVPYTECYHINIHQNIIRDFYVAGVYISRADSSVVSNNSITKPNRANPTDFRGIVLLNSRFIKVYNNTLNEGGNGRYFVYGIQIQNSQNSLGYETEIVNNVIGNFNTNLTFDGINFIGTINNVKILHNTIWFNAINVEGSVRGVLFPGTISNILFKNNLVLITGSGTSTKTNIVVPMPTPTFISNNNILFNNATGGFNYIGNWNGNKTTLTDWISASKQDSNSVSVNPFLAEPKKSIFTPLNIEADNIGKPIGVLTDIFGNARSQITPDAGAIEFTGYSNDLSLDYAYFGNSSLCNNVMDTAFFVVRNVLGSTINFALNPLTIQYKVDGKTNTNSSLTINSDSITAGNSKTFYASNINMMLPGKYMLSANLQLNAKNLSGLNDTLLNNTAVEVLEKLKIFPKYDTVTSNNQKVVLTAYSPIFQPNEVKITEICHERSAPGTEPVGGWPSYLLADDYIELTGVPNSDIGGYILEEWTENYLQHAVTFKPNTNFSNNGILILATGQLGLSSPSPQNFYYHTGNQIIHNSVNDNRGYVLKSPAGKIIDVVVYGNYVFPPSAKVSTSHWSGTTPGVYGAGIRLIGADNNTSSGWISENANARQTPNVLNPNVPIPQKGLVTDFNWKYNGNVIDSNIKTNVGPFSTSGNYIYLATYTNSCGTYYDTAYINANISTSIPNNNEKKINYLKVYPNPNNGQFIFNVGSTKSMPSRLVVQDYLGKIIYNSNVHINIGDNNFNINLELPNGIYFVILDGVDSIKAIKFIVVH